MRLLYALAARMKSLQAVPITFADRPPVYVDLRKGQGWIWLKGSPWTILPYERDEQCLIERIIEPSDVMYDVGANIGLYTTLFSRLAAKVIAFEPNPQLLPCLLATVADLENVDVYPVALSNQSGRTTLYVPNDHTMGSLADYTCAEELSEWKQRIGLTQTQAMTCDTATLDELIERGLPSPDFIKCDVEGAELMVFEGARKTLAGRNAPMVLFEVLEMCSNGFGVDQYAASDFLKSLGYELFDVGANGCLAPMERKSLPAGERADVLAVPHGRRSRITQCPNL